MCIKSYHVLITKWCNFCYFLPCNLFYDQFINCDLVFFQSIWNKMKVAVIGQSQFGEEVYKLLRKDGHEVVGVFTIPDVNGKPDPLGKNSLQFSNFIPLWEWMWALWGNNTLINVSILTIITWCCLMIFEPAHLKNIQGLADFPLFDLFLGLRNHFLLCPS